MATHINNIINNLLKSELEILKMERNSNNWYIDTKAMYSAIKALIEIPKDGRSIATGLNQNLFTDACQRWIVMELKEYYKKYNTPITYDYLISKTDKLGEVDKEYYTGIIQEIKNDINLKDSQWVLDEMRRYTVQQTLIGICNQTLKDIGNGANTYTLAETLKKKLDKVDISNSDTELPPSIYEKADGVWNIPREYIPTRINGFDEYFYGGLDRRKLTMITAGAGVGKTTITTVLAHNASLQGYNTLHIILEDDENDVVKKYLAKMINQDSHFVETHQEDTRRLLKEYRNKEGGKEAFENFGRCLKLKKMNQLTTTADSIVGYVDKITNVDGWKPDMVIIDYFSALKMSSNQYQSRVESETKSMRKLEKLAEDYNMVVVVAEQVNRTGAKESGMDNVQGAFTKGQIAANYIEVRKTNEQKKDGKADILIHKVRNGKSGVELRDIIYDNARLYIDVSAPITNDVNLIYND